MEVSHRKREDFIMPQVGHLMIEAKQAITDEQLQRFLDLARGKHWEEAAKQLGITLACVAELLNEGAQMLHTSDAVTTQVRSPLLQGTEPSEIVQAKVSPREKNAVP